MQSKASLILKRLTNYRRFSTTKGFASVGLDGITIGSSSLLNYCSGRRNPNELLFLNLNICFLIIIQFQA